MTNPTKKNKRPPVLPRWLSGPIKDYTELLVQLDWICRHYNLDPADALFGKSALRLIVNLCEDHVDGFNSPIRSSGSGRPVGSTPIDKTALVEFINSERDKYSHEGRKFRLREICIELKRGKLASGVFKGCNPRTLENAYRLEARSRAAFEAASVAFVKSTLEILDAYKSGAEATEARRTEVMDLLRQLEPHLERLTAKNT